MMLRYGLVITLLLVRAAAGQCPGGQCPRPVPLAPYPGSEPQVLDDPIQAALPAIVRVCVSVGGAQSLGSGTLIDKNAEYGLVLTCAHVFRDGAGRITVVFPDGRCYGAKLLQRDEQADLAALLIFAPQAIPLLLSEATPASGAWAASCGYGPYGQFGCNRGRVIGITSSSPRQLREVLEISGAARQGDSGGPVLDAQGRVVAVLFGTDGRVVDATTCRVARRFLSGLSGRFRSQSVEPGGQRLGPAKPEAVPGDRALLADAVSSFAKKIDQLGERLGAANQHLQQRLGNVERGYDAITTLARTLPKIEERLRTAGAALDKADIDVLLKAAARRSVAAHGPSALQLILVALAGTLGLSAPPVGVFIALKLVRALFARRLARRGRASGDHAEHKTASTPRGIPLHDDYARQLLDVFQLSGRSPVQDATLGREYDEAIRRAEQSSDANLAGWARKLRERVADKFHRIHTLSPAPAEPIETPAAERQST